MQTPKKSKQYSDHEANPDRFGSNSRIMSAAVEAKARDAEQSTWDGLSGKTAFDAAVEAAELYLQALKLADNRTDRARLSAKCKELLSRSEQLGRHRAQPLDPEQPVSTRTLTTREKIILVEGSKLNGFKFPIWERAPGPGEFELKDGQEQFVDSPRLQLSPLQLESFAGWKRPGEALGGIEILRDGEKLPNTPTMARLEKIDLVQDMTSDCSVVASLCAGTARAERGHPRILASVIHPYDQEKKSPKMSPSGRYILRLYFNGCYRKVEIDDFLPVSSSSRVLHVLDRSNPGCLWPALLEKAYLKVRGGYDFPGSNSGTDIAVFTGWIPEQVFLHDEDVIPEELWTRIYNGFNSGGLLLTIGTGQLPRREQRHLGLAAEHDYAILELKDTGGVRELLIKNPWSNGEVWKGAARQRPNPGHEEIVTSEANGRHPSSQEPSAEMTHGTFWMDFGSIFQHFENLYLNWHPGLFICREDLHFTWDVTSANLSPGLFENRLQFSITSTAASDIWLLLNRHFRTGDYMTSEKHANGFISLYLFHAGGHRVLLSDGAKLRGPYVDSPNTLLKFSMPAKTTWTVVVASQNLPPSKHNFSLSAFSNAPVQLVHASARYASIRIQHGAWTRSMAGGNSDSPTYLTNPQFSFQLPVRSALALTLSLDHPPQLPQADYHIRMLVVFTDGRRVTKLRTREIVADSKDYRRGSAAIEATLEKGSYTIICSTFERDQYAKFTLSLHTSTEPSPALKPLPPEGSGRLTIISDPAMFSPDTTRLLAPVKAPRLTRATFIAKETSSSTSAALKPSVSSLFKISLEQGQGPYKTVLSSSASDDDDFVEIKSGVRIDDVDLRSDMRTPDKGWLWLVVERMAGVSSDSQGGVSIQVEVLSEERIELGAWGRGDG